MFTARDVALTTTDAQNNVWPCQTAIAPDAKRQKRGEVSTKGPNSSFVATKALPATLNRNQGDKFRQDQVLQERRARNRKHARETRRRKKVSMHQMLDELEELRRLKARHDAEEAAQRRPHRRCGDDDDSAHQHDDHAASMASETAAPPVPAPGGGGEAAGAPPGGSSLSSASSASSPSRLAHVLPSALERVLALRAQADPSARHAWAAACTPDVALAVPCAPYRYTSTQAAARQLRGPLSAAFAGPVVAQGVDALMNEAAGLALCLGTISLRGMHATESQAVDGKAATAPAGLETKPTLRQATCPSSPASVFATINVGSDDDDEELNRSLFALPSAFSQAPEEQPSSCAAATATAILPRPEVSHVVDWAQVHLTADGLGVMAPFELQTTNLTAAALKGGGLGLAREVAVRGTVRARFEQPPVPPHPADGAAHWGALAPPPLLLLKRLELVYDTMSFWRQLEAARAAAHRGMRAQGVASAKQPPPPCALPLRGPGLRVHPATLEAALRDSPQPRAVVCAAAPHYLVSVNASWRGIVSPAPLVPGAVGTLDTILHVGHSGAQAAPGSSHGLAAFAADVAANRPTSVETTLPGARARGGGSPAGGTLPWRRVLAEASPLVSNCATTSHMLITLTILP